MFSHIMIGANDLDASRKFYDATLGELGLPPGRGDGAGHVIYRAGDNVFALTKPLDGRPASFANGGTIGFLARRAADVDAWHKAGVAAGGAACEDPPGIRRLSGHSLYLAYLRDPVGNKLCAYFHVPN
ncbi:VOC family protein [Sphingobium sp. TKS]|uniref:VOC family protein n=1 Tax=Sphingobium sp. TKS TaxID=1315974 RepID=UPI0007704FA3|nr:VOC family protein [Sphingobium sp. TKS]AMK25572.1 glyoxalase/bleomycin resistance protein/dioxygenase [Sphingobium sp. TKS]